MPEGEEQLALTLEELSRFFEVAAGTRFENYFVIAALCGARPQEILGLKCSDVKLPKEDKFIASLEDQFKQLEQFQLDKKELDLERGNRRLRTLQKILQEDRA